MKEKCRKSLMEAAVQTFEDLGMMLLNEELTKEQREAKSEASVMVTFEGPFTGRLEVTVYGAVTKKLASNISGSEEISSDILSLDALGEMLGARLACGEELDHFVDHDAAGAASPVADLGPGRGDGPARPAARRRRAAHLLL